MSMQFNDAFFRDLSASPKLAGTCERIAEQVAETARSTAPVESGAYRDAIKVVRRETPRLVTFRVVGGDWKTMLVESRTGNLVRALREAKKGL
ncbi:hypothetical protein [Sinomonas sp. ASV322]|uniref:hypothetical protein n=1 Tax=Sinomonas sp. ASV322 TaxID=3041920 RepID=UPI0027DB17FA|nr:hypothetical protein [Sinomonas sp. ASV322]MDQ4502181.1 hypothetical protein [Sinomonas sp. ASV322]